MFKVAQALLIFSMSISLLHPVETDLEPVNRTVMPTTTVVQETAERVSESVNVGELQVAAGKASEIKAKMIEVQKTKLTEEEIFLIAWCMVGEAEGEPEEGKRLVIDVIFNRLDSPNYPDTIHEVIYQKDQFDAMHNGRAERCKGKVTEEMLQLVREEAESRTNSDVLYFRTRRYHSFGTPEVHVGDHYFSS